MKILIIETYYPRFLQEFYGRRLHASEGYDAQWRALMDRCFGIADFYSTNLRELGHESTEIVANAEPLQRQWARQHGLRAEPRGYELTFRKKVIPWVRRVPDRWFYHVLKAQVEHYRPDVLHIQDMNGISTEFLREIRPSVHLITGQIACAIRPGADFTAYDVIFSSFPHFVDQFRAAGLDAEYLNLAFEARVLDRLDHPSRKYSVTFVGGLSPRHGERVRLLERLAEAHPLDVWGYGAEHLPPDSPLRDRHHGEAWGLDMYRVLRSSDVVINTHIDVAGRYANNMRLYEATGVGSLLVTDQKENLETFFEDGREVVSYRSVDEAVELVGHYLDDASTREAIAAAGQRRTLREHTYAERMREFVSLLEPRLGGRAAARHVTNEGVRR